MMMQIRSMHMPAGSCKRWGLYLCAVGCVFLLTGVLQTKWQKMQPENGLNIFASSDKQGLPAFMMSDSGNCPLRNVSIMKKTANFTRYGLLSYPGSGNTWTRHLVQQLTGFCTGTVYCDKYLSQHGFPGECIFPNNSLKCCIMYKSHQHEPKTQLDQFDKAVILIRNPFDALKAYFNWRYGKSTSSRHNTTLQRATAANFLEDHFHAVVDNSRFNSTQWELYVTIEGIEWQTTYTNWLKTFANRSLLIRYDHLKEDLLPTLRRISHFLNVKPSEAEYTCTYANQEGQHHRKQKYELEVTDIFSEKQIEKINSAIMGVMTVSKNKYGLKDFIFVSPD